MSWSIKRFCPLRQAAASYLTKSKKNETWIDKGQHGCVLSPLGYQLVTIFQLLFGHHSFWQITLNLCGERINSEFEKYIVRADLFLSTSQLNSSRQLLDEAMLNKNLLPCKICQNFTSLATHIFMANNGNEVFAYTNNDLIHTSTVMSAVSPNIWYTNWILHNQRKVNHEIKYAPTWQCFSPFRY